MVDVKKLKARMVLMGHTQKSLAAEMKDRGVKISENTLSSKMNGKSQFDCLEADVICDILNLVDTADRAEIFLA
jgi:predicted peroxiredoxin